MLAQRYPEAGLETDVTIYERNDYIGGRTNVKRLDGWEDEPPVELGASIFVPVRAQMLFCVLARSSS